jgi:hypothetical protein
MQALPIWLQSWNGSSLFSSCGSRGEGLKQACPSVQSGGCSAYAGLHDCFSKPGGGPSPRLAAFSLMATPQQLGLVQPAISRRSPQTLQVVPGQSFVLEVALLDSSGQRLAVDLLAVNVNMTLQPAAPAGNGSTRDQMSALDAKVTMPACAWTSSVHCLSELELHRTGLLCDVQIASLDPGFSAGYQLSRPVTNGSALWPRVSVAAWKGQYELVLKAGSPEDAGLYRVGRTAA